MNETRTIDKLFLELSQFTTAKTQREIRLEKTLKKLCEAKSWGEVAVDIELSLAKLEKREPEQWALDCVNLS